LKIRKLEKRAKKKYETMNERSLEGLKIRKSETEFTDKKY
jgi:hypothetical protein